MDKKQNRENINRRLLREIKELKDPETLKEFLEELLINENADLYKNVYKEEYKRLIDEATQNSNDN